MRLSACHPECMRGEAEQVLDDVEWQRSVSAANALHSALDLLRGGALSDVVSLPFEKDLDRQRADEARAAVVWLYLAIGQLLADPRIDEQLEAEPGHMLDYFTDRDIPREIRRALFERDIASVYLMALVGAAIADTPLSQAVTRALYDGLVRGLRQWFDLVACFYGVPIPAALRDSVNWQEVLERHIAERDAARVAHAQYVAGGRKPMIVFPPEQHK